MLSAGKGVAIPLHHGAAHVVDERDESIRDGVVLGVEPALQHGLRGLTLGVDRSNALEGPEPPHGGALPDCPGTQGGRALIVSPHDNGNFPRESQLLRNGIRHGSDGCTRRCHRRQFLPFQAGCLQELRRPVFPVHVEEKRAIGEGVVRPGLPAQHEGDEAVPDQEVVGILVELGPVLLRPHDLSDAELVRKGIARQSVQLRGVEIYRQRGDELLSSLVQVHDRRPQNAAVLRDRHEILPHGGDRERLDGVGTARRGNGAGNDILDPGPDAPGVQLGVARLRPGDVVLRVGRSQNRTVQGEYHGL